MKKMVIASSLALAGLIACAAPKSAMAMRCKPKVRVDMVVGPDGKPVPTAVVELVCEG